MKRLTFEESVMVAINSLSEGVVDKQEAIKIIENAACGKCFACTNLREVNVDEKRICV